MFKIHFETARQLPLILDPFMKTVCQLCLVSAFLATQGMAEERENMDAFSLERLQITFSSDQNGNTSPSLFIPVYWSENLFSAIGYKNVTLALSDFSGGVNALEVSQQETYNLNVIQYQESNHNLQYSIGLAVKYSQVENFGTLSVPGTTPIINLNISTDIKAFSAGISGDAAFKNIADFLSIRTGGYIYPYLNFDVTHNLNEFTTNSNLDQEITYKFFIDTVLQSGYGVDLSLSALYSLEAYNYAINELDSSLQPAGTTTDIETSFKTVRGEVKLLLSAYNAHGINPMLGYAYENVHTDYGSGKDKTVNNLLIFGFEKPF